MTEPALRVPGVTCPRCGSAPALRCSRALAEAAAARPADERLTSFQCQACLRVRRVTVYWLTAGDYARALEAPPRNGNGHPPG